MGTSGSQTVEQVKRRRIDSHVEPKSYLPVLNSAEYFVLPSLDGMVIRESFSAGYCARIPNLVIGKTGYGQIRFCGETDVRWLDLDRIVKFSRHSVVVYDNENEKPPVGHGLNKPAEVTLILKPRPLGILNVSSETLSNRLRTCIERQGARFISFNISTGEWKFSVDHFSRFGLAEDDDDIFMDDAVSEKEEENKESQVEPAEVSLSHSLPTHLGLDPIKMQEMRAVFFPAEEIEEMEAHHSLSPDRRYIGREHLDADLARPTMKSPIHRSSLHSSFKKTVNKISPLRKAPQALLEYKHNVSDASLCQSILLTGQNKGLPLRTMKVEGFKLKSTTSDFAGGCHSSSKNIADAGFFMGRSFRVGWGPNGVLVHCGSPVRGPGSGLSSVINIERVALDNVVRDKNNKLKDELVDICFSSPLNLHRSLDHDYLEIQVGSSSLKLQKAVASRVRLPHVCGDFISIIEKKLDVLGLSASARLVMVHQVMVWELIKVLYSEREVHGSRKSTLSDEEDNAEGMVLDKKDISVNMDPELSSLVRRADFCSWLRESVCHRVQEDVSCLNSSNDLQHILLLLTGRQLDAAVELAASRGDVRLAILLSLTGGSMVNRNDMSRQLDFWRNNGMNFGFIEEDMINIYELLAGNVHASFSDVPIDWKRYLGLVMWYNLPPDTPLPLIISTYQQLLIERRVPHPVPIYVDEGQLDKVPNWREGDRYDLAYYLMLLYANSGESFNLLKTMFSAISSTSDPLDYHMIWHQRAILEAIGAFSSNDLHVLDMSFISQLLQVGQCQWAIYVATHMPYHEDFPHLHSTLIREILFQYCETWSAHEEQWQFIENLGVPPEWMHEALATYYQYYGDLHKALEHLLKCSNWLKAHSVFMTSESHSLFLSSQHAEICRIARHMEDHKMEIANWDLGAGIFIDFYDLKSFMLQDEDFHEPDILESRTAECRNLFRRMDESLRVWGSRLPLVSRVVYSEMVEQLCKLLVRIPGASISAQMSCFQTMLDAPVPESFRSSHLQDAVSVFTYFLSSTAT